MLCEECGKAEANVHVTKMVNGEVSTQHLCTSCAREKGEVPFMADPGVLIQNVMAALMGHPAQPTQDAAWEVACPACGLSFSQFQSTGRLGCPECYETFAPALSPLIERIQAADHHTGRVPSRLEPNMRRRQELAQLQDELRGLVAQEAYEEAARVRDRIRALESEEKGEGGKAS